MGHLSRILTGCGILRSPHCKALNMLKDDILGCKYGHHTCQLVDNFSNTCQWNNFFLIFHSFPLLSMVLKGVDLVIILLNKSIKCVYLSANRFPKTWENGIRTSSFRFCTILKIGVWTSIFVFRFCVPSQDCIRSYRSLGLFFSLPYDP